MPLPSTAASQAAILTPYHLPRRDLSGIRPEALVKLTRAQLKDVFRGLEPSDVTVVWPNEWGYPPPLRCRFVPKAPRLGNYLYLRRPTPVGDRDGAYWCVKMRDAIGDLPDRWSTKCGFDELLQAAETYCKRINDELEKHVDGIAPRQRLIVDVLKEFVQKQADRIQGGGDLKDVSFVQVTYAVDRLVAFVDGMLVEQATPDFTDRFMLWAKGYMPAGCGYSHNTARASIFALRFALVSVLNTEEHFYQARFPMPPEELGDAEVFYADELARIEYAAATGKTYDPETGTWSAESRPTVVRRAAVPYGLVSFIGSRYGERIGVILELTWDGADGTPWIDLEGKMIRGLPLGRKRSKKGTGDRPIPEAHLPIFHAWREAARKANRNQVIHNYKGNKLKEEDRRIWRGLLAAAGVKYLPFHALKHTCVTILRVGGVPKELAAIFLHTLPQTLDRYYGVRDANMCRGAVEAIASLDGYTAWGDDRRANFAVIDAMEAANGNALPNAEAA